MKTMLAKLMLAAVVIGGGLQAAAAETANIWVRADGSNFMAGLALLSLVDGQPAAPGIRKLPCRLVVRQSCGRPPG